MIDIQELAKTLRDAGWSDNDRITIIAAVAIHQIQEEQMKKKESNAA